MKFHLYNEAGAHLNGRLTYTAGGEIARGDVLKFDTDGNVVKCAAASDAAIGVALDGAASGEIVAVAVLGAFTGTVVVKASAAVAKGAKVTPLGAEVSTSDGATDAAIGVALDAATAAGDLIEVAHCVRQ